MSNIPTQPGTDTPEPVLPDQDDDAIGRPLPDDDNDIGNDLPSLPGESEPFSPAPSKPL